MSTLTPDFDDWVDTWFVDSGEIDSDAVDAWNLFGLELAEYYAR